MKNSELVRKIKRIGLIKTIDDISGNKFSFLKYLFYKSFNKMYFGSYLASKQGNSRRHYYMQELLKHYSQNSPDLIKILEIGSWAGGSAITWAEGLEKYCNKNGHVFCVDKWVDYFNDSDTNDWTLKTMKDSFKKQKIYKLFIHNVLSSGYSDMISINRFSSEEAATIFKENSFDIVFIDANHKYDYVSEDLIRLVKLVKDGGVICGDDLEMQYTGIDLNNARRSKNMDVVVDENSGKRYHPGVTLAVYEFFKKEVSCYEGFWVMEKRKKGFKQINLGINDGAVIIPGHLK